MYADDPSEVLACLRNKVHKESRRGTWSGAAAAGCDPAGRTAGTVGVNAYTVELPADTSAGSFLDFAQRATLALGVQPGQGWQWISRGRDQLPK